MGTLCSLITKGTTPKDKSGVGEVNFVKVENINPDNSEISSMSRISIEEHEGYLKRSKLKENDILFSIAGTLGRVSVVKSSILPANTNQALAILRIKEGYIPYITTVLKGRAVEDFIKKNPTVGAQPNLSLEQVNNLEISLPNYEEQKKIGEYFSNLDRLITLHQRKFFEAKNNQKNGSKNFFRKIYQKLYKFDFNFKTYDWEQRKFPEFVEFYNGLTYSPDDVRASGTLVLRSSNVKNGEIVDADNVYVEPDKATSENVKEGDIIVVVRNGSRALIGKHAEIKESMSNTVIGAFMSGIRSEHSSFVNALLDTNQFEKEIEKNMGATINQITGYMFSKMEFTIPSPTEQDKIGNYFKYLDHLITLHQREVFYTLKHIFYRCCDTLLSGGL